MAWANNDFSPEVLSGAVLSAMQKTLSEINSFPQSQDPTVEAADIDSYQSGLMRVNGIERLSTTCYISAVNFYLNQADKKPKGVLVMYLEVENASKFFKGLHLPFPDDEDDASMFVACGQFAVKVAEALRDELSGKGYAQLFVGKPRNSKSSANAVEFSPEQKTMHQINFYYLKHKVIGLDVSLAPITKK